MSGRPVSFSARDGRGGSASGIQCYACGAFGHYQRNNCSNPRQLLHYIEHDYYDNEYHQEYYGYDEYDWISNNQ